MKCNICKRYTGVGSRKTPLEIMKLMERIGLAMRDRGYTLRSGGADGADTAFARGLNKSEKEVFLPWHGFNGLVSDYVGAQSAAVDMARKTHPAWQKCSAGARKLHARNVHQVLGWDMEESSYSEFLICWTPNGEIKGGTATAIRLAIDHNIPVYNLAIKEDLESVLIMTGLNLKDGYHV